MLSALECPLCRRALSSIAGVSRLSLLCGVGHAILVDDFLRCQADSAGRALENVLDVWKEKRRFLSSSADQACAQGYADVGLSFRLEADRLGDRIARLERSILNEVRQEAG
jgi:hypothetical protein